MSMRLTLVAASLWVLSSYSTAQANFADVVEKTIKSVCLVTFGEPTIVVDSEGERLEDFPNSPFNEYLKKKQEERPQGGAGTCFVINANGKTYLLTNQHVASTESQLFKVTFYKTIKHHPAKLVANDKLTDLALLEMENTEGQRMLETTPALPWGNSSKLRSGDSVYAIGHPLGMEWSVSRGIVSNPSRRLQNTWQPVIQTDVAINVGNSGGPLFNMQGEVVGVNTFIFSPGSGGSVGVNFSVDGNQAQYIVDSLLTYGKVKRSRMGLAYIVDKDKGVLRIEMVMTDSPAERAGIEKGDVLLKINERDIVSSTDIGSVLDKVEAGTTIGLIVERNGMIILKELITGEMID